MTNSTKTLKPGGMLGIRHVALFVQDLETAVTFYHDVLGMKIEWQPDTDNVYLTNDGDVLALHRIDDAPDGLQRLDHIGFVLKNIEDVDHWYNYLMAHNVLVTEAPKTHRDGARGFYCLDPVGNFLEFIFHPPISGLKNSPKISG
jgi:catechol 2,3-dioxygenase-like lactoylglutathione lyase family enzyme